MKLTTNHEIYLCSEVLLIEPYQYKHGSKESGGAWQLIADELNAVDRTVADPDRCHGLQETYENCQPKFNMIYKFCFGKNS